MFLIFAYDRKISLVALIKRQFLRFVRTVTSRWSNQLRATLQIRSPTFSSRDLFLPMITSFRQVPFVLRSQTHIRPFGQTRIQKWFEEMRRSSKVSDAVTGFLPKTHQQPSFATFLFKSTIIVFLLCTIQGMVQVLFRRNTIFFGLDDMPPDPPPIWVFCC